MNPKYKLQFFTADRDGNIIPLFSAPGEPVTSDWHGVIQAIQLAATRDEGLNNRLVFGEKAQETSAVIQILLVKTSHLRQPAFYYNLCCDGQLRRVEDIHKQAKKRQANPFGPEHDDSAQTTDFAPSPVITVGVFDIMPIYEESPGLDFETISDIPYWKNKRKEDQFLYKLHLDHRVKFLDASIWHRYISLNTPDTPVIREEEALKNLETSKGESSDFDQRMTALLKKIIGYYDQELYDSVAAVTTLEFDCRMLLNSFIQKAGDRGHHEAVTPFKFHSETIMEQKSEKLIRFLEQEREGGKKLSRLRWNVLLVDDHSSEPLSLIFNTKGTVNKKTIIEQLLRTPNSNGQERLRIEIGDSTEGDTDIISKGIEKLTRQGFDIILLDYLLGQSETNPNLKAYGHEFLLELATNPEHRLFRRGPMGRFWIYPISSFPNAFTDKLRQLNIDGSNRNWHIANGGDPISTPELFRINFYRLILRQITEFYVHEAALEQWPGQFMGIQDKDTWCEALEYKTRIEQQKLKVLANHAHNSPFQKKMRGFLERQKSYFSFWKKLERWSSDAAQYKYGTSGDQLLKNLQDLGLEYTMFDSVCESISDQLITFLYNAEEKLLELACEAQEKNEQVLSFTNQSLFYFPEDLPAVIPNLKEIDLSRCKLSEVPELIGRFQSLTKLNLSENADLCFIPAKKILSTCLQLRELNLRGTKIGEMLESKQKKPFANTRSDVEILLEHIHEIYGTKQLPEQSGRTAFISYSRKVIKHKSKLTTHLSALKREGFINLWFDGEILPGNKWDEEIKQNLDSADIILLLIESNFMDSAYIWDEEMPIILEKHRSPKKCRVIPIYLDFVEPGNLEFTKLLGLPAGPNRPVNSYRNREKAWAEVSAGIRRAILEIS